MLTASRVLTVLAVTASARDLYLTRIDLDRRQKKHVKRLPVNHAQLPDITQVRRQDSWVAYDL